MSDELNYFDIFGIPKSFNVDMVDLEHRYVQLQKSCHPDVFFSILGKRIADMNISKVHKAYSVLSSDLKRAEYLLGLGASGGDGADSVDFPGDPDFLADFFSLQDSFSSGVVNKTDLIECLKKKVSESVDKVSKCFADSDYDSAGSEVTKLRYLSRFLENTISDRKS